MSLIFGAGLMMVTSHRASRLSETAYDLLRIGGWALVVFGALLALVGLIRFYTEHTRA
jgi:hypothetical protein